MSSTDSEDSEDQKKKLKKSKHKKKSSKEKKKKKEKKHKSKSKKNKKKYSSEDSASTSSETDIKLDSKPNSDLRRDDWMTADSFVLQTFSKEEPKKPTIADKNKYEIYDPKTSVRELNPYWKSGEGGLPSFKKPTEDDDHGYRPSTSSSSKFTRKWQKKNTAEERKRSISKSPERERSASPSPESKSDTVQETSDISHKDFLTDKELNELAAKMLKAELMGNKKLAADLKARIERAKECKKHQKDKPKVQREDTVVLSLTGPSGHSRPVTESKSKETDPRRNDRKNKKRRTETHLDGERTRYYPDDDKYDIKTMFENERYADARDQDIEFAKTISKVKNSEQNDLVDIFSDNIRKSKGEKRDEREEAIREHNRMQKVLDSCDKCFDSPKMSKELIIYVGDKIYLSIPWHEGLVLDHLVISPVQHISCSTQADEDIWEEISNLRKLIVHFYAKQSKDVIFFEIAKHLHRRPHMQIHCVAHKEFELAQFYFKKAIQESDAEWAMNKKLIDLKQNKNDIKRSVPKGLPYFWVNFGMDNGMAHVIEDQEQFPSYFAQEIIGGILNLDVNRWRKPRKEYKISSRIKYFENLTKTISNKGS